MPIGCEPFGGVPVTTIFFGHNLHWFRESTFRDLGPAAAYGQLKPFVEFEQVLVNSGKVTPNGVGFVGSFLIPGYLRLKNPYRWKMDAIGPCSSFRNMLQRHLDMHSWIRFH